jgi:alkylhydroperoxidase/carboxymuconolactone decarboxylase family protein YurZ
MDKFDEISRRRKQAHHKLLSLKSKVYQSFLQMEQATYTDGALPKKTKELIAIGISVLMDCPRQTMLSIRRTKLQSP